MVFTVTKRLTTGNAHRAARRVSRTRSGKPRGRRPGSAAEASGARATMSPPDRFEFLTIWCHFLHFKSSVLFRQPLQHDLNRGDGCLDVHVARSTSEVCPHVTEHDRWHRRPRRLEANTVREARGVPDSHSLASLESGGGGGAKRLHRALLSASERNMYERHDARPFSRA
jgi:hypothetical protein